jgi:hypothetical protein
MAYDGYRLIHIAREGRIVTATVDNPPINIITNSRGYRANWRPIPMPWCS